MAENVGGIYYDVELNTAGAIDGSRKAEKAFDSLTGSVTKMAAAVASAMSVVAIAGQLKKAAAAAGAFEQSVAELSAITGAAGDQIKSLSAAALEMGSTTTTSARQAVEAMKLIASAKPELLENTEALKSVTREAITLAEAAGMQLPEAATALALSMNQFGEGADQAARYINVLAAGAKFGSSEIHETAAALKNAGVSARSVGLSFESTSAAIQALAETGIKAGEAGTGLRNILLKLENAGDAKLKPSVVGLTGALDALAKQNLSSAELTKLFGLESINAAQALITARDRVGELTVALTGTNTAYEQAAINTDTLEGSQKRLANTAEVLYTAIGQKLLPTVRESTDALNNGLAVATANLDTIIDAIVTTTGALATVFAARLIPAALGAANAIVVSATATATASANSRMAATGFEMLGVGMKQATTAAIAKTAAVRALNGALAMIGGPAGVAMLAAFAVYEFFRRSEEARQKALELGSEIDKLSQSFRELNKVQAEGKAAETAQYIRAQKQEIEGLDRALRRARFEQKALNLHGMDESAKRVAEQMAILTAKRETAQNELNKAIELEAKLRATAAGEFAGPVRPEGTTAQPAKPTDEPTGGAGKPSESKASKFDSTAYLEDLRKRTQSELDQIETVKQAELRKNQELLASGKITAQQAADARLLILQNSYNKTRELMIAEAAKEAQLETQKQQQLANARMQAQMAVVGGMSAEDQILVKRNMQLTEMEVLRQQDLANEQIYLDAMVAIRKKADEDIAKLAEQRQKDAEEKAKLERLAIASGFEASAGIIKAFAGEQSREYKAMLVASKSYALAEAAVQQGVAAAKAFGAGDYWTAALRVAGVVTQFASIYSAINSAGGRLYGGGVEAGSMYRVNENGQPEMFQASNGRQYMMPTTSGKVVPSGDIGSGDGVKVVVNNYAGADIQTSVSDDNRTIEISVRRAVAEVANGLRTNTGQVWAAAKAGTNIQGRVD